MSLLCKLKLHDIIKESYEKLDDNYYIIKYRCSRCGKRSFEEIFTTPFRDLTK